MTGEVVGDILGNGIAAIPCEGTVELEFAEASGTAAPADATFTLRPVRGLLGETGGTGLGRTDPPVLIAS